MPWYAATTADGRGSAEMFGYRIANQLDGRDPEAR